MTADPIPSELRRFLQSNALTIPHIELILLLHRGPSVAWLPAEVARRLYVPEVRAAELLSQIEAMGAVERVKEATTTWYYRPATPELAGLLGVLDIVYAKNLLAVTRLVHAARDASAEQFAKAFDFRKDRHDG